MSDRFMLLVGSGLPIIIPSLSFSLSPHSYTIRSATPGPKAGKPFCHTPQICSSSGAVPASFPQGSCCPQDAPSEQKAVKTWRRFLSAVGNLLSRKGPESGTSAASAAKEVGRTGDTVLPRFGCLHVKPASALKVLCNKLQNRMHHCAGMWLYKRSPTFVPVSIGPFTNLPPPPPTIYLNVQKHATTGQGSSTLVAIDRNHRHEPLQCPF